MKSSQGTHVAFISPLATNYLLMFSHKSQMAPGSMAAYLSRPVFCFNVGFLGIALKDTNWLQGHKAMLKYLVN